MRLWIKVSAKCINVNVNKLQWNFWLEKSHTLCYVSVQWFYSFLIVFLSIHSILLLMNIRMAVGVVYNTIINVLWCEVYYKRKLLKDKPPPDPSSQTKSKMNQSYGWTCPCSTHISSLVLAEVFPTNKAVWSGLTQLCGWLAACCPMLLFGGVRLLQMPWEFYSISIKEHPFLCKES